MWHLRVILTLLVLSIGFVEYLMDLLVDVLNALNEVVSFVSFILDMSRIHQGSFEL